MEQIAIALSFSCWLAKESKSLSDLALLFGAAAATIYLAASCFYLASLLPSGQLCLSSVFLSTDSCSSSWQWSFLYSFPSPPLFTSHSGIGCLETARAWPTRPFDCQRAVISTAHFVRTGAEILKEKEHFCLPFPLHLLLGRDVSPVTQVHHLAMSWINKTIAFPCCTLNVAENIATLRQHHPQQKTTQKARIA